MKVAICVTENKGLDSLVDSRFGRTGGFLLCHTENEEIEYLPNQQNLNASQGAGIQAAQNVVGAKVQGVATGFCGPKAFQVLSAAGVQVFQDCKGTVREVLQDLREGKLTSSQTSNKSQGHW